jgi:hypothetical protein
MTSQFRHDRRAGRLFRQGRVVPCGVTVNYRDDEIASVDIDDVVELLPDGVYQLAVGTESLGAWLYWRRQYGAWNRA